MKNMVIKTIAIITALIVLSITLSLRVDGYDMYTYSSFNSLNNVELVQNKDQVFLIGTNRNDVQIDAVYPDCYSVNLTLENDVYSYGLFSDSFVFICPQLSIGQTQIVIYNIFSDTITSFYIDGIKYLKSSQFAYADRCVFIADNYGNILRYSEKGELNLTYEINNTQCHLMCDYYGNVYCIANNGVYKLSSQTAHCISSSRFVAPARFIHDDVFVDSSGYVYKITSDNIFRLINTQTTSFYSVGGICDNCVITADYDKIDAIYIEDESVKSIKLQKQISSLCVIDDNLFAFNYYNGFPTVSHIKFSKLKNQNNEQTQTPEDISDIIGSSLYTIDNEKHWIVDIEAGTTVAQFKRNMSYDGFKVSFIRYDGKVITSGNIGTATVVTFYNDNMSVDYELSVKGDLTGEGNVNTRDKNVMFDYLLDNISLTGVYLDAADMDYSNKLNTVDLVILATQVHNIEL